MKYVWDSWDKIGEKISRAGKILLFLDFDGTLAPVSRYFSKVKIAKEMVDILERLAQSKKCHIVIISGRALRNLKLQMGVKNVSYIGNHGVEMDRAHDASEFYNGHHPRKIKKLMKQMKKRVEELFRPVTGVRIEDKVYSLSIHFRSLVDEERAHFRKQLDALRLSIEKYPVLLKPGKKVWEIRHKEAKTKGSAAEFMLRRFRRSYPIAIGDDVTDEDMFRVLGKNGVSLRVRHSRFSNAGYYVKSVREVGDFLEALWSLLKQKNLSSSKLS